MTLLRCLLLHWVCDCSRNETTKSCVLVVITGIDKKRSYEKNEVDDDEKDLGAPGAADFPRPEPARVAAAPLHGGATCGHLQRAPVAWRQTAETLATSIWRVGARHTVARSLARSRHTRRLCHVVRVTSLSGHVTGCDVDGFKVRHSAATPSQSRSLRPRASVSRQSISDGRCRLFSSNRYTAG